MICLNCSLRFRRFINFIPYGLPFIPNFPGFWTGTTGFQLFFWFIWWHWCFRSWLSTCFFRWWFRRPHDWKLWIMKLACDRPRRPKMKPEVQCVYANRPRSVGIFLKKSKFPLDSFYLHISFIMIILNIVKGCCICQISLSTINLQLFMSFVEFSVIS